MNQSAKWRMLLGGLMAGALLSALGADPPEAKGAARIRIDRGHLWRPPFGLERVGQPLTAIVEIFSDRPASTEYSLAGYLNGEVVGRHVLVPAGNAPHTNRVSFVTAYAEPVQPL